MMSFMFLTIVAVGYHAPLCPRFCLHLAFIFIAASATSDFVSSTPTLFA